MAMTIANDRTIDEESGHGLVLSHFCRENCGFDGRAVADFLNAFDDDYLAGLYAAIDNPLRADTLADFDHTDVNLVVAANDGELVGACISMTARCGTRRALLRIYVRHDAPNWPGRKIFLALGNAEAIRMLPVAMST